MATNTLSSTIVLQLLRKDNYWSWSAWMKNYLLAQDLWDIVEATTEPPKPESDEVEFKAWRKNNAAALHAILISCEMDIQWEIKDIHSAKIVWDKLATMYGPSNSSNIPIDSSSNNQAASLVVEGAINNDLLWYEDLIRAIEDDWWHYANHILSEHEDAKRARISRTGGTILHEAVRLGRTEIVEKLVELMSKEELEIRDNHGYTALALAAGLQNTRMVECMLRKNFNLLNIPDNCNRIPLIRALEGRNIEVARSLYSVSLQSQTLSNIDASTVLTLFILQNKFDLALPLLDRSPGAAIVPNKHDSYPLFALATKSSAFRSGTHLVFWKNWIYACIPIQSAHSTNEIQIEIHNPNRHQSDQEEISISVPGLLGRLPTNLLKLLGIKQIYEMKLLHHQANQLLLLMCRHVKHVNDYNVKEAIIQAIKGGIVEFIFQIIIENDSLLYTTDTMGRNALFYSVLHRQAEIFGLLSQFSEEGFITHSQDSSRSTILHMAAMLEPSGTRDRIPGEALKMQSELQWFKEVERICPPWIKDIRNDTKMTPRELFTHNHKDMMKEGEKWMKNNASSCTVVGALIVTIMFTTAFTVPGGNNQNTGFPMFTHKKLFSVFIISNALSLISSSISVLIFLGILTSRYAEEDFLISLPTKMIIGLFTLFFSITTMMIAFCAGLIILLPGKSVMTIPVICLASVTVILFAFMQFPILFAMIKSTYGPSIFNRPEMKRVVNNLFNNWVTRDNEFRMNNL